MAKDDVAWLRQRYGSRAVDQHRAGAVRSNEQRLMADTKQKRAGADTAEGAYKGHDGFPPTDGTINELFERHDSFFPFLLKEV